MDNEENRGENSENIGLKMLLKMGYKPGEGLGVRGQGIREPIKIEILPKNAGLGSHKEKIKPGKKIDRVEDKNSETSTSGEEEETTGEECRASDVHPKTASKFRYHQTEIKDIARFKVLKRVEELQITLMNLIDTSNITELTKKQTQSSLLKNDLAGRSYKVKKEKEDLEVALLEKRAILQISKETRKRLALPFRIDIKEKYRNVVECIDDSRVILSILLPIFKKSLQETSLLQEDLEYLKDQMIWLKEVLRSNVYTLLSKQTWLPRFRRELDSIERVKFWGPVLNDEILESLRPTISHLISVPSTFRGWEDALSKSKELSELFAEISASPETYTLLRQLYKRLPFDLECLRKLFDLWRGVMPGDEYKNLQDRLISPYLLEVLKQMTIDPSNQNIDPILAALDWKNHLNLPVLFIESQLTLKLKRCLYYWLHNLKDTPLLSSASGYHEVADWYEAWKKILYPTEVSLDILDREFVDLLKIVQHFLDHRDGFLSKILPFDELYEKIRSDK